jgi:hypothetical protein
MLDFWKTTGKASFVGEFLWSKRSISVYT